MAPAEVDQAFAAAGRCERARYDGWDLLASGHPQGGLDRGRATGLRAEADEALSDRLRSGVVRREHDVSSGEGSDPAPRCRHADRQEEPELVAPDPVLADRAGNLDLSRDGEHRRVQRAPVEPVDQSVAVVDDLLHVDAVEGGVEGGEHPGVQARDRGHASYGAVPGGAGGLEGATQVAKDVIGLTGELDPGRSR